MASARKGASLGDQPRVAGAAILDLRRV